MAQPDLLTPQQISDAVAGYFGQPVVKLTAPGGQSRTSFRAYLADRTIIVSQRHDASQAQTEHRVLMALQTETDHVPRLLGRQGTLLFQSDVGANRLNGVIHTLPADHRNALAAQAVEALFAIHRAAHRAGLGPGLPTEGVGPTPDDDLIGVADRAATQLGQRDLGFDPTRLSPWFAASPTRFVKWDCRAGNAALDTAGTLRWFDFEDARLGHGPEDFAWLIADETWPLSAQVMLHLVRTRLSPEDTASPDAFMTYLQEFATLHAIRRIRLIFAEARRLDGWLDQGSILKYDRVGVNPHMAERLSQRGAALARCNPSTVPLVPLFAALSEVFRKVRQPKPQQAKPQQA
ncbi:MAG: phosphotransferase [Cypionkella sp.]